MEKKEKDSATWNLYEKSTGQMTYGEFQLGTYVPCAYIYAVAANDRRRSSRLTVELN